MLRRLVLAALSIPACSAAGGSGVSLGDDGTGGGRSNGPPPGSGGAPFFGDAGLAESLSAHIEHNRVKVTFLTVSCAGQCADVEAIATGGAEPYTFTWEDGSTGAARRVCPTATTEYEVTVADAGISSGEIRRPPDRVKASLTANVLTCPIDGGAPVGDAGNPSCASGDPAVGDPLGGTVTYFRQGAIIPAGRYRVAHTDGCMRFGEPVGWTIHNQLPISWFLVGETAANVLGTLPGVVGLGYEDFDACVATSQQTTPLEIDFAGGKLGVAMVDYPLDDNIAGIDGRSPTWCLTPVAGI